MQQVGVIRIDKQRSTVQVFGCPTWFQKVVTDPGVFNLNLLSVGSFSYWLNWKQPGTVVESCFDVVTEGKIFLPRRNQNIGHRVEIDVQIPVQELATLEIGTITLQPEWQWLACPIEEWRPHLVRLRAIRTMHDIGIDVRDVTYDSNTPERFQTTVKILGRQSEKLEFQIDQWNLLLLGKKFNFGDVRNSSFWKVLYEYRFRQMRNLT